MADDVRTFTFDAGDLARAWLSVALASGEDEAVPALDRTVLIELFSTGVRLVALDSTVLLRSWVPLFMAPSDPPALDEAPDEFAIAIDPYGRGKGLMKHLLGLARAAAKADAEPVEIGLRIGMLETNDLALAGMESRALFIEHPGHEEVALTLYEGQWPDWRGMLGKFESENTRAIALNPHILDRLAKLGKLYAEPLVWRFGGSDRMALLECGPVLGAVMPMRLQPAVDAVVAGSARA